MKNIFNNLENRADKFEHYFELYEKWFSKFVNKSPKILEIGVQYGGSAELWSKYFGANTEICGIDINISQAKETDYLKLIKGDQSCDIFWENFINEGFSDFDIIIEDGSHENSHQITTLIKTFNLLKNGGVYWCEDTHTSYYHNVRVKGGGYKSPKSFIEYSKNIIDVIHREHTKFAIGYGKFEGPKIPEELINIFRNTQGVHFYDSVVVIEKGKPLEFKRITK